MLPYILAILYNNNNNIIKRHRFIRDLTFTLESSWDGMPDQAYSFIICLDAAAVKIMVLSSWGTPIYFKVTMLVAVMMVAKTRLVFYFSATQTNIQSIAT